MLKETWFQYLPLYLRHPYVIFPVIGKLPELPPKDLKYPANYRLTSFFKCTLFQFSSTVHAKVSNSNPINYIVLRSAINTVSIGHNYKLSIFLKFEIQAGMPTIITKPLENASDTFRCSSNQVDINYYNDNKRCLLHRKRSPSNP